jgi:uncharacterized FlgJ-related protein
MLIKRKTNPINDSDTDFVRVPDPDLENLTDSDKQEIRQMIQDKLENWGMDEKTASYWVAISEHETGRFTSDIFKENRNLFGMRLAKIRDTTAIGENRKHAVYASIEDSIEDLSLYLEHFNYPSEFETIDQLVSFMAQKGYFTADKEKYLNAVKGFINDN